MWEGQTISNLHTGDVAGQHNRLAHVMGPHVSQYGTGFKPNLSLEVRDIDGAYARRKGLTRTTNPLDPEYKLPSYKATTPPVPK